MLKRSQSSLNKLEEEVLLLSQFTSLVESFARTDTLLDIFRFIDNNQDGRICKVDILKTLENIGMFQHNILLTRICSLFGLKEDKNVISYSEFCSGYEKIYLYKERDDVLASEKGCNVLLRIERSIRELMDIKKARFHDIFNYLDDDQLGKLSMSALGKGLNSMGIDVSRQDIQHLFKLIDSSETGFLTYPMFYAALQTNKARELYPTSQPNHVLLDPTKLSQVDERSTEALVTYSSPTHVDEISSYMSEVELFAGEQSYVVDRKIFENIPNSLLGLLFSQGTGTIVASRIQRLFLDFPPQFIHQVLESYEDKRTSIVNLNSNTHTAWLNALKMPLTRESTRKDGTNIDKKLVYQIAENDEPIEIQLREYERLILESIEGSGRIYVNAYDLDGKTTVVSGVVFDSSAYFHCEKNGITLLSENCASKDISDMCQFPGGYKYEFFVHPTSVHVKSGNQDCFEMSPHSKVRVKINLNFIIRIDLEQ